MAIKDTIRVSISEAAKLFGVNAQTIRRAIKNEELSYVIVQGRYKISFESLLKWSGQHTSINNKMQSSGIGQFVDKWKIRNKVYAPNPEIIVKADEPGQNLNLFSIQPADRIEVKPKPERKTKGTPASAIQNPTLPL
ncbi:MAG: helix-turn-helix domain-containing protein [Candidatus Magasanikbacteria bacterium]|nr:helix-turn-helix domain-containing protein [Candidatus Magasanikbacteria bacterium]